jgi:hypothetical protein
LVKHTHGIPVINLHELLLLSLFYPMYYSLIAITATLLRNWVLMQLANELRSTCGQASWKEDTSCQQ